MRLGRSRRGDGEVGSRTWRETFGDLGHSILSLAQVELEAFERDVARWGKSSGLGLALLGAAAACGFWIIGFLFYALIQGFAALGLPEWAASLVSALLFTLIAGLLAWLGMRRLQAHDNPLTSARLRMDDHMDWWQTRVFRGEPVDLGSDDPAEPPWEERP
jgi:hypothetical protein